MVRRPCTAPGQSGDETRPTVVCVNWNVSLTTWHCFEMAGIASRKRPRLSSDGFTTRGKHKIGYNASWKTDFPWHTPVYNSSESTVIGLLCCVCKRHSTKPRNHFAIWTTQACTQLRTDALQRHKDSLMHKQAQQLEAARVASERDGGIRSFMPFVYNCM